MAKLLEQAVAGATARPEAEQDALAARILSEIEDERQWDRAFEFTTGEQWDPLWQGDRRHPGLHFIRASQRQLIWSAEWVSTTERLRCGRRGSPSGRSGSGPTPNRMRY